MEVEVETKVEAINGSKAELKVHKNPRNKKKKIDIVVEIQIEIEMEIKSDVVAPSIGHNC